MVGCCLASGGCKPPTAESISAPPVAPSPEPIKLVDRAATAGLNYAWQIPGPRPLNILQGIGNGCAFLDYDNDGCLDILLVGPRIALFRGDGKGRFSDVTRVMGLSGLSGAFLGCAVGDYDNDSYPDIYISGYRTGVLLHNDHGKRFSDVTARAGLKPQPWGTACAWAETEPGSGRLDLFVANYARFGAESGIPQLCMSHGVLTTCPPRSYAPLQGVFYRNMGGGRFQEASRVLNIGATHGRGLGAAFAPLDSSGLLSLVIANDEKPGDLLSPVKSAGGVQYTEIGAVAGIAYDRDANLHAGMGIDWGDYDNDGRLDLFVTAFQGEAKSLYHNDGSTNFTDAAYTARVAQPSLPYVTFGCKLFDVDNDGWLDLILANGHIQDNIRKIDTSTDYRQPTLLLHNLGGAPIAFDDVSARAGKDLQRPIVGRGLAVGDYDNDGRVDVLVVDSEGSPLLLHNESAPTGHWLGINLVGVRCNRDGIGAVVTAAAGGRTFTQLCHTDGSYLSASDKRVHFGLGTAATVDTLTIRWPGGHIDTLHNVAADRYLTVREGGYCVLSGHAQFFRSFVVRCL